MADKTIYDLTENQSLDAGDLFEQDVLQNNERKSLKTSLGAIAEKINTSLTYSGLNTTSKTVVGAINELEQGGGGGGSSTLAGLTDVDFTNLSDEDFIQYDATNQEWVNVAISGVSVQPEIYSTEERVVGCWTDGKPLYQKTITLSSGVTVADSWTTIYTDALIGTIGQLVKVLYDNMDNYGTNGVMNYKPNGNNLQAVYPITGGLNVLSGAKFTLWYTKTADTAGSGPWTPSGVPAIHYSTDEHVIGTWIDGSTLYEKTIQTTSPSSRTDSEVADLTSLNIDILVDLKGVINSTTVNQFVPIFWSYPADSFSNSLFSATYYAKTEKKLRQVTAQAAYQSSTEYITIQYTKSSS